MKCLPYLMTEDQERLCEMRVKGTEALGSEAGAFVGRRMQEAVKAEMEPVLRQEGLAAGACWREASGPHAVSI